MEAFFVLIGGTHSSKVLLGNALSEHCRSEVFIFFIFFYQDHNDLGKKLSSFELFGSKYII